jgi:hypothetical protein
MPRTAKAEEKAIGPGWMLFIRPYSGKIAPLEKSGGAM